MTNNEERGEPISFSVEGTNQEQIAREAVNELIICDDEVQSQVAHEVGRELMKHHPIADTAINCYKDGMKLMIYLFMSGRLDVKCLRIDNNEDSE